MSPYQSNSTVVLQLSPSFCQGRKQPREAQVASAFSTIAKPLHCKNAFVLKIVLHRHLRHQSGVRKNDWGLSRGQRYFLSMMSWHSKTRVTVQSLSPCSKPLSCLSISFTGQWMLGLRKRSELSSDTPRYCFYYSCYLSRSGGMISAEEKLGYCVNFQGPRSPGKSPSILAG